MDRKAKFVWKSGGDIPTVHAAKSQSQFELNEWGDDLMTDSFSKRKNFEVFHSQFQ